MNLEKILFVKYLSFPFFLTSADLNIKFTEQTHFSQNYTVAGKAIGFALEQPLHVVALAYSAF
ncbi:MAG: hypothetical protein LBK06_02350 [Planctomycetaceae bacterium]|nr:hypothetical protein [Planctomycetaceae bacterium]